MRIRRKETSLFAQMFGALPCVILCACATPTIDVDNSEDELSDLSVKKAPTTETSLITKDVLRYYVFDTLRSVVNNHFNGMCYAKNGVLAWDPEMDHSNEYYSYRLSGDTLFFSNSTSLVKTYIRETNDGSALGGRWILLEDESEIFTPEYLIVSGLTAVWEFSIKEIVSDEKIFAPLCRLAADDPFLQPVRPAAQLET